MSRRAAVLLAVLWGAAEPVLAAAPPAEVSAPLPELLFGASEEILDRALIPSERNAHGEVRLVRRGEAACVQTVLCSPALVRGVRAIERKEREAWPAEVDGHEDSERFLDALERSVGLALEEFAKRSDGADARRKLLIELVLDGEKALVALYGIDVDTTEGRLDVTAARPFFVVPASPGYVRRSQELQLASAFRWDEETVQALLASAARPR